MNWNAIALNSCNQFFKSLMLNLCKHLYEFFKIITVFFNQNVTMIHQLFNRLTFFTLLISFDLSSDLHNIDIDFFNLFKVSTVSIYHVINWNMNSSVVKLILILLKLLINSCSLNQSYNTIQIKEILIANNINHLKNFIILRSLLLISIISFFFSALYDISIYCIHLQSFSFAIIQLSDFSLMILLVIINVIWHR